MTKKKLAKSLFRKFDIVVAAFCLMLMCLILVNQPANSQTLPSVSAEVRNLRSRIARVEAEVRNLRSSTSRIARPSRNSRQRSTPETPPNLNNRSQINNQELENSDPMFKRLATLVIELKEEVRAIDKRLVTLEKENS